MAKKGRKLTGKARATALRNLAKARKARGGGNPRRAPARRRAPSGRLFGGRRAPRTELGKTVQKGSKIVVKVTGGVAAVNVPMTIAGRPVTHPLGGLHISDPTIPLKDWGGQEFRVPYLDVVGIATNTGPGGAALPQDTPVGQRLMKAGSAAWYNARRTMTPGTRSTFWGPIGIHMGARAVDAFVVPMVVDGMDQLADLLPSPRRA